MTNVIDWDEAYTSGRNYKFLFPDQINKILSFFDNGFGAKKALDLGCGTGQLTRELYHRGFSEILGVDGSREAIGLAKSASILSNLEYRQMDLEKDFSLQINKKYDLIVCKDTFAFIENKVDFLESVNMLLQEKGIFVLISPNPSSVLESKKHILINRLETEAMLGKYFDFLDYYEDDFEEYYVCKYKE